MADRATVATGAHRAGVAAWWPLAALIVLAAVLRLGTLDLQSFWYDEAYVPVHTLHASLGATLRSVEHRENTPPLWYVLIWGWSRVFGTSEVALRLPSALAGIATVAVAWGIGRELTEAGRHAPSALADSGMLAETGMLAKGERPPASAKRVSPLSVPVSAGRRAAIATAALVAFNPLLVWYSQEARAYGLFVFFVALAMWCWLRADADPTPGRLAAFAASGAAALATHYFAVFLLAPMCLWLLRPRRGASSGARAAGQRSWPPRGAFAAVAAIGAVGLALIPLALAQGGHGTQWIGEWALSARLETIPQYYLTGYSGAPLGHGVELLVALAILAGMGYGLWRALTPRESDAALLALGLAACGVLIPAAMAVAGADYLAPRNVVAAMIPLTAGIAVIVTARRTGRAGMAFVGVIALAFLALSVDVNLSPRLQRGDWRGLARAIGPATALGSRPDRAITTVELGAAPLEYYLPTLHDLPRGATVRVSEIDETGYLPLSAGAGEPPAPGFQLVERRDIDGMILYRFRSAVPRTVSEEALRSHVIAEGHPEVLVGAAVTRIT